MRAESVKKKYNSECYNEMRMKLPSLSVNEGMARAAVSAFCAQLDPTASELADIKCAVSEAVTNCIVHAYRDTVGIIYITVKLCEGGLVRIEIKDKGCGIENVEEAMRPLFTTDPENERSGMGFTIIENFMDSLKVNSTLGKGTRIVMTKKLSLLPVKK